MPGALTAKKVCSTVSSIAVPLIRLNHVAADSLAGAVLGLLRLIESSAVEPAAGKTPLILRSQIVALAEGTFCSVITTVSSELTGFSENGSETATSEAPYTESWTPLVSVYRKGPTTAVSGLICRPCAGVATSPGMKAATSASAALRASVRTPTDIWES